MVSEHLIKHVALKHTSLTSCGHPVKSIAMGKVTIGEENVCDFLLGKLNTFLHSQ